MGARNPQTLSGLASGAIDTAQAYGRLTTMALRPYTKRGRKPRRHGWGRGFSLADRERRTSGLPRTALVSHSFQARKLVHEFARR